MRLEKETNMTTKERKPVETTENKTRKCPMYKVLVHNDDETTYTFVVATLVAIFKQDTQKASSIAQEAHIKGLALVTVLPLEQAELRVEQAHSVARTKKYPLTFSYEPE